MFLYRFRWLMLFAMAMSTSFGTRAEGADDLKFTAGVNVMHDSNLFRLPSGTNTVPLIGKSSAAETVNITSLGLNYNKAYSLQRVELDLTYNKYRYQNFDYLSFAALNYRGAWRWSYTPHLYGNVTSSRNQTLNSFLDFRGFNQRNERVDTATRVDATYELDARWRLIGGVNQTAQKNALQIVQEADYNETAVDTGVRYVFPSGSSASYTRRSTDGTYINRPLSPTGFFDTGYTQTDNNLQATWALSRDSSAVFRVGHRSRTHPNYPQRDFSGMTGGANFNWAFSAKSALTAGWTRELGPYEAFNSNFSQIDRFSIGPVWQIGPKTTVRARLEHAIRDYGGTPGPAAATLRRDTTRDASISVDWQPFNYLSLNASLQNARRSANLPGLGFNSNMINLTAQFTY